MREQIEAAIRKVRPDVAIGMPADLDKAPFREIYARLKAELFIQETNASIASVFGRPFIIPKRAV